MEIPATPPDELRRLVLGWLRLADNDLRNIELVLPADPCPLDTVAYHAQQAVEKSIKALLTSMNIPFPQVLELMGLARLLEPALRERLWLDDDDLALISRLAASARHPQFVDASDRESVEYCVNVAQRIRGRVLTALAERGIASES